MAALVFEHKAVDVAWAVVLNTLLVGCKLVQQVVAAFLKCLQMIAIRDSVKLQGGNQTDYKQHCYKKKSFPTLVKGGKAL